MSAHDTTVRLNDHFDAFAREQVETGRYASTSEVVQAGLGLLEEREAKIAALNAAIIEGEESGDFQPFDAKSFLAEMHADAAG